MVNEIAQNKEEDGDRNESAATRQGKHEIAHEFTPAQASVHAFPIPLPRCEVTTIKMRARPLSTKVSRKSTRPSSIRDWV